MSVEADCFADTVALRNQSQSQIITAWITPVLVTHLSGGCRTAAHAGEHQSGARVSRAHARLQNKRLLPQ